MQRYTIKETSELSGLPESTLRYYETMGLISQIARDPSGHRSYDENNINLIIAISCLSATGMSIGDMRTYLSNIPLGEKSADEQIKLLEVQKSHLATEAKRIVLKRRYVETKIAYWKAIASGNSDEVEVITKSARLLAKELKWLNKK